MHKIIEKRKSKNSKIAWLGNIPFEWNIKKGKYVYSIETGKKDVNQGNDDGKYPFFTCSMLPQKIEQYSFDCEALLVAGNGIVGYTQYYNGKFDAYQRTYILSNFIDINPMYLKYYTDSNLMIYLDPKKVGSVIEFIKLEDLQNFPICFPPKKEQDLIVKYLNKMTDRIDSNILLENSLLKKLKKYKQILITETVTKGLNKKVKLKNSGLRDINKIPSEWCISRIKYVFSGNKGLSITKEDLIDDGLPVLSYGQIHSKINTGVDIKDGLIRYVDCKFEKSNYNSLVKKNDFVFADTSEDYEGCGNCCYKRDDSKLYAGYHTIVLHSKENNDNRYFAYLFKTDIWRKQIRELADGIKVYSITQKILMNANVIVPPLKEQKEIADFLDKKCPAIDKLIELKEKKIELLNKYKKSLIYECVTGKRKIND